VARVRLYLMPDSGNQVFRFIRPGGVSGAIPAIRLRSFVRLVSLIGSTGEDALRAGLPQCIVDTGSLLSIIPEYIWIHFRAGAVTPLPFHPAMSHLHRFVSVGKGNYPYQLAEVPIRLWDQNQRTMDMRIVAQLTQDGGSLRMPMTLGLRGGVIDGRIIRSEPDSTVAFGQAWWLEDP
jgi:hypothetical protein